MPGAAPRARSRPWRQGRAAGAALTAREAAQPTLLPAACSDGACAGSQSVAGSGSPSAQSEIENKQTPEPGLATAWAVRCIGHGNVTVHCATCTQLVIEPAVPGWLWPRSDLASDCDEWDRLGAQDGPPLRRPVASWPSRRQQLAPAGSSWLSWNDGNRLAIGHGKPGECALRQALPLPDSRSIAGSDVIAVCSSLHAKRQTAESGFRVRPLPAPDAPVTRADGAASRLRTPTAPRRRRAWRDGPARLPEPAPPRWLPRVCPSPRFQHPAAGPRIVASLATPCAVSRPRSLPRLPQPSSAVHANRGAPVVMPEQRRLWRVTDCRLAGKATTLPVGPACREKEGDYIHKCPNHA